MPSALRKHTINQLRKRDNMKPNKLYMVSVCPHGDGFNLLGIFSTRKKAEAIVKQHKKDHPPYSMAWTPTIDEVTVDEYAQH